MGNELPNVATAEEIRVIATRALEILDLYGERDDVDELDDDAAAPRRHVAYRAAKEGLRFAAAAAGQLGDPGLVPILVRALREIEPWDGHAADDPGAIAEGLTALLAACSAVPPEIEELVEDPAPAVRAIVAQGIRPTSAKGTSLLEKLALDPVAEVRQAAKEALSAVREVPWWQGKFDADPAARLTPEEAVAHKETLVALSVLLDQPRILLRKADDALAALLDKLPDPLAVEAARILLSGGDRYDTRLPAVGAVMASRPGGEEALVALCQVWAKGRDGRGDEYAQLILGVAPERREALCVALARWAASQPQRARRKMDSAPALAAGIAGKAFPPSGDLRPILELLLASDEEEGITRDLDWVVVGLNDAFEVPGVDPAPIADELIAARLAGHTGQWRALRSKCDDLLLRLPPAQLRAAAEATIHADGPHAEVTQAWGLERLLVEAHDPSRDPEPIEQARRFLGDPRLRKAMLSGWEVKFTAVVPLREALRAGELDFVEAAFAVAVIHDLWGGRVSGSIPKSPKLAAQAAQFGFRDHETDQRAARVARFAAFFGPEALRGPVTEDEWAALRRARALHTTWDHKAFSTALTALPRGPWHPEDRALLDRAMAARAGGLEIEYAIATALAAKPQADDLRLFHELARLSDPDSRSLLRSCYVVAREIVGPLGPEHPAAEEEAAAREWMDEEEDDADDDDDDDDDD
jgi:hypothetical protein